MESEHVGTGPENCSAEDVGRHQVRRCLDTLESEAKQAAQGLDHQCLGDARYTFEQRMALAQHGDQHLFDSLGLPGYHAAQLGACVRDELAGCLELPLALDVCVFFQFLAHEGLSFLVDSMLATGMDQRPSFDASASRRR